MLHTSTNSRITFTYNVTLLFGVVPLVIYCFLDHPLPGVLTFWPFLSGAGVAGFLKQKKGLEGWWIFMCMTSAAWPTMLTAVPSMSSDIHVIASMLIIASIFIVWTIVAMTVAIVSNVYYRGKKGSDHG